MAETRVLYQNDVPTPLGTVRVVAEQRATPGLSPGRMRVFGGYAVVLLETGGGWYRDIHTSRREIAAGDAILVLPDVPHLYRSRRLIGWDETYVTFDGPAFDQLRECGLLRPEQLVVTAAAGWRERFRLFVQDIPHDAAGRTRQVARLHELLVDLLADAAAPSVGDTWLDTAKAVLERNLEANQAMRDVAEALGMSEQAFRKRFARAAGVSPARYRTERRLAAAANLMRQTTMPLREIAEALGFVDEFHLSKRFKAWSGLSPSVYRRADHGGAVRSIIGRESADLRL